MWCRRCAVEFVAVGVAFFVHPTVPCLDVYSATGDGVGEDGHFFAVGVCTVNCFAACKQKMHVLAHEMV